MVTDKLRSYPAAKRQVAPSLEHRALDPNFDSYSGK